MAYPKGFSLSSGILEVGQLTPDQEVYYLLVFSAMGYGWEARKDIERRLRRRFVRDVL